MEKSEIRSRAIKNAIIKMEEDEIASWERRRAFISKKPADYIEKNLIVFRHEDEQCIPGVPAPTGNYYCYYWAEMSRDAAVALLKCRINHLESLLAILKKTPYEDWKFNKTLAAAYDEGILPTWTVDVPAFTNLSLGKGLLRIIKSVRVLAQTGKKPTHKEINAYLKENFGVTSNNSETVALLTKCGIFKNFKPGYAVTEFGDEVLAAYGI